MNCVIIEDELAGQEIIKFKLRQYFPEINILSIIDNKSDAADFINENKNIDFIFLDIEIKGGNSLDIFSQRQNSNFEIIFVSAYDNFAIDAFKIGAAHYLLKPFNDQDFKTAIQRVLKNSKETQVQFLNIPFKNQIVTVPFSEIIYLKSDGSYTEVITDDKIHLSSKNLGDFEKILDKNTFFRVHHSFLVNLSKIDKIEKGRNGQVFLTNGETVPISQRKINDFLTLFSKKNQIAL
jgi:two-component system LytT family response regulator